MILNRFNETGQYKTSSFSIFLFCSYYRGAPDVIPVLPYPANKWSSLGLMLDRQRLSSIPPLLVLLHLFAVFYLRCVTSYIQSPHHSLPIFYDAPHQALTKSIFVKPRLLLSISLVESNSNYKSNYINQI